MKDARREENTGMRITEKVNICTTTIEKKNMHMKIIMKITLVMGKRRNPRQISSLLHI